MALQANGGSGRSRMADINMTPMIDVLLVLLVIFMLAQPLLQRSIDVQLPLERTVTEASELPSIVLEIAADGSYRLNREPVPVEWLVTRLREVYAGRPEQRVLFVAAHDDVIFQDVIAALDAARAAGVSVLGAVLSQP